MGIDLSSKAFLIGNGIHRAITKSGVKSWKELLAKIASSMKVKVDLDNEYKPFPLLLEEILFQAEGNFDNNLQIIKENIATFFQISSDNELHKEIVNSGIEHILTTNYDYAFEKVLIKNFNNEGKEIPRGTNEILNSIKRRSIFKKENLSVWHMHGEINQRITKSDNSYTSNSILIGNEHYSSYFYKIQKYVKSSKGKNNRYIIDKINDEEYRLQSWIDAFFMKELCIAGFSFDFSEYHLWWLLNFRAKLIAREKITKPNVIKYYYAELPDAKTEDLSELAKQITRRRIERAKVDLFKALDIKTIKISCANYKEYFEKVFEQEL